MSDVQREITEFWNARAADYDAHVSHGILDPREQDAWIAALAPLVPAAPSDVLDLGTGTGTLAFTFAAMGHRVQGTDLAGEMLAAAREKAARASNAPRFLEGDAVDPQFPRHSFESSPAGISCGHFESRSARSATGGGCFGLAGRCW